MIFVNRTNNKKFALIGLRGSGKSTFASKLGKVLNIPVHHLDKHMFEPDGKKKDKQEFIEVQKAMLSEEAWIVEGCSFSTFEMRFAKADILIYFHFSRLICFFRLFKRIFNYEKDFGGLRAVTMEILKYTWNFDIEGIDAVRNILNRCWFDEAKCLIGIKAPENYKKEWNDRYGCWGSKPLHNFASHGSDAFRVLAVSLNKLEKRGLQQKNGKIYVQSTLINHSNLIKKTKK